MLATSATSTADREGRRARGCEMEKLVERKTRRDDTTAEVDGDDRLAGLAAHLRPEPAEAEDCERVRRDQPLTHYALDRDVDQPADDDRHHHQQRHPRA